MNPQQTRSLRKIKHALVIPAVAAAVLGSAAPALAAARPRGHARPTPVTAHAHSHGHAGHFQTDGRKVG